jgi:hypothetical protein
MTGVEPRQHSGGVNYFKMNIFMLAEKYLSLTRLGASRDQNA